MRAFAAPRGADLVVDRGMLQRNISVITRNFDIHSCAVRDGCVRNAGQRKLLTFFSRVINEGDQNLELGAPNPGNSNFTYSSCSKQSVTKNWVNYELVQNSGPSGRVVVAGRKLSFCAQDSTRSFGKEAKRYHCEFQGLSSGWTSDVNEKSDCQWLDVTGIKPGSYTLKVTVNPDGAFSEADFSNNSTEIDVVIP